MENVKNHAYVKDNRDAHPIIYEVLNFLEDMNSVSTREYQVIRTCVTVIILILLFLTSKF